MPQPLTRKHQVKMNMPQMIWGHLSENWLLKELGDQHWNTLCEALGVESDQIYDTDGNRLYASFVRVKWQGSASLNDFHENDILSFENIMTRFGSKMFFSENNFSNGNYQIKADLISVFSSRKDDDNSTLKKGSPANIENVKTHTHSTLPHQAKEFIDLKNNLFQSNKIHLKGWKIGIEKISNPCFTSEHQIDFYDDVNGVGLLYFASYPKISDKHERTFFHEYFQNIPNSADWAKDSVIAGRDIYYFGNANAKDVIKYTLIDYRIEGNDLRVVSKLTRKSDNQDIAIIDTTKRLTNTWANLLGQETVGEELSIDMLAPNRAAKAESSASSIRTSQKGTEYHYLSKEVIEFIESSLSIKIDSDEVLLSDIGLESILFIELSEYLNKRFDLDTKPSKFYECRTLSELIVQINSRPVSSIMNNSADLSASNISESKGIAIVGSSFRLPGASTMNELWDLLINGKSLITQDGINRWKDLIKEESDLIQYAGFINNIDMFDPLFFRISPREAELMDPQQRILLELTWELIESSGYKPSSLSGSKTGLFIGSSGSDYELLLRDKKLKPGVSGTGTASSILANRISYFFDFTGPSLQLDTACSSSLYAVHHAVQSIRNGSCESAIAGGINILADPNKSQLYVESNMLSPDSKCYTFDERANGYVRGEGAVLFFLKPINRAISDGDDILGVIKGSSANHGGLANGLTVPNPSKQQELIEDALRDASITSNDISYVETHGTGTILGDPIEVKALSQAFRENSKTTISENKCGLGSIKSNIGHLEAAAGVAGMLKVLAAFEHKQIPPTINFEKLNPNIELDKSPFYIQNKATNWGRSDPDETLKAGVSSFGIGGSNAHVILESYKNQHEPKRNNHQGKLVFPLSAKTEESLDSYVKVLTTYLVENPNINLADIAYSLQECKEEFSVRMALMAENAEELIHGLKEYKSDTTIQGVFKSGTDYSELANVKELKAHVKLIIEWLGMNRVDWSSIQFGNEKKIALPPYQFSKLKYWIPKSDLNKSAKKHHHPFISSIHSEGTFNKIEFHINGNESFISDHIVEENKVLPGVAYLEWVRESASVLFGYSKIAITNIVWMKPIIIEKDPRSFFLEIESSAVQSAFKVVDQDEYVFCQGSFKVIKGKEGESKEIMFNGSKSKEEASNFYDFLWQKGLKLGSTYQTVKWTMSDSEGAVAEIFSNDNDDFILPPGALDGALQNCLKWYLDDFKISLALPFVCDEIRIYSKLPKRFYSHAQKSLIQGKQANAFDIDLVDEGGKVYVQFKRFVFVTIHKPHRQTPDKLQIFEKGWLKKNANFDDGLYDVYNFILIDLPSKVSDKLTTRSGNRTYNLKTHHLDLYESYSEIFEFFKEKLPFNGTQKYSIIIDKQVYNKLSGLSGFCRTLNLEYPDQCFKLIVLNSEAEDSVILDILIAEKYLSDDAVFYDDLYARKVLSFTESHSNSKSQDEIFKKGGVYLITGGSGKLGKMIGNYISDKFESHVILSGRRKSIDWNNSIPVDQNLSYQPCDLSNYEKVDSLIKSVLSEHGRLDGIIHASGTLRDSLFANKSKSDLEEVLKAKMYGVINLDRALDNAPIDFFAVFSSWTGTFGNIGQSDYAIANSYLDAFTVNRNELVQKGMRKGKSVSVIWPLWKNGGMQVKKVIEKQMIKTWGTEPLSDEVGISALLRILQTDGSINPIVYYNDKLEGVFALSENTQETNNNSIDSSTLELPQKDSNKVDNGSLEVLLEQLRTTFAEVLLIPNESIIDPNEDLSNYGLDSVYMTQLVNEINSKFDIELSPNLFFNANTLTEVANHLIDKVNLTNEKVKVNETSNKIRTLVSNLIKLEADLIDLEKDLDDYGVDSVLMTQLSNDISKEFNIELSPTVLMNFPTISGLTGYLNQQYQIS